VHHHTKLEYFKKQNFKMNVLREARLKTLTVGKSKKQMSDVHKCLEADGTCPQGCKFVQDNCCPIIPEHPGLGPVPGTLHYHGQIRPSGSL
jgi:hypothetical protein